jgi:hypothetical protein
MGSRKADSAEGRPRIRRPPSRPGSEKTAEENEPVPIKPVKEPPTVLSFILIDRPKIDIVLKDNPQTYMELQEQIARYTPKLKALFVVRNSDKRIVTGANFVPGQRFFVNQLGNDSMGSHIPVMPLKWEFTQYYAKPKEWVDQAAEKAKKDETGKGRKDDPDDDLFTVSPSNP